MAGWYKEQEVAYVLSRQMLTHNVILILIKIVSPLPEMQGMQRQQKDKKLIPHAGDARDAP